MLRRKRKLKVYATPDVGELRDGDLRLVLEKVGELDLKRLWVPDLRFGMFLDGVEERAGGIQLRLGDTDELLFHGGHIGYAVEERFQGQRLAARSVRLLLPVAKAAGFKEIWITCDPANIASRRSIEIAGGEFVEIREIAEWSPMRTGERTHSCRFRFDL